MRVGDSRRREVAFWLVLMLGTLPTMSCSRARNTIVDADNASAGGDRVGLGGAGSGSGGAGGDSGGGAGGTAGTADAGTSVDSSCTESDAHRNEFLDVNLHGQGFDAHNGRTIYLFSRGGSAGIIGIGSAVIVAGGFVVHLPRGYRRNVSQRISWYVDDNGDGTCNTSTGDHKGSLLLDPFDPVGLDAVNLTVTDNHLADASPTLGACDGTRPFEEMSDMDISASGFGAHDGTTVRLLTSALTAA